ncbi:MAG: hypothetical protein ACRDNS_29190 [Trebonia sp.]
MTSVEGLGEDFAGDPAAGEAVAMAGASLDQPLCDESVGESSERLIALEGGHRETVDIESRARDAVAIEPTVES